MTQQQTSIQSLDALREPYWNEPESDLTIGQINLRAGWRLARDQFKQALVRDELGQQPVPAVVLRDAIMRVIEYEGVSIPMDLAKSIIAMEQALQANPIETMDVSLIARDLGRIWMLSGQDNGKHSQRIFDITSHLIGALPEAAKVPVPEDAWYPAPAYVPGVYPLKATADD